MRIAVGADHSGVPSNEVVIAELQRRRLAKIEALEWENWRGLK
jgi:ribose 5-phosphate isomerase RpiB